MEKDKENERRSSFQAGSMPGSDRGKESKAEAGEMPKMCSNSAPVLQLGRSNIRPYFSLPPTEPELLAGQILCRLGPEDSQSDGGLMG